MLIYGLDFTSAPSRRKPITCVRCLLQETRLTVQECLTFADFAQFEAFLQTPGPWLLACDFPLGLPRLLLRNLGWPENWADYAAQVAALDKTAFVELLTRYQASRAPGDKLHLRVTDRLAGACSPMMLYRVPVAKMFFQGVPRLLASGVSIYPLCPTADERVVLEGYPALVARHWLGRRSYKSDERKKQTTEQREARNWLLQALCLPELKQRYGVELLITPALYQQLVEDPMGDLLDALLCALQAAWAYTQRAQGYGLPAQCDRAEGWIVDPQLYQHDHNAD